MADDKATDEQVFESIVRQWEGGEHANAGKRASVFMQGKGKGKREELETEFQDRAPGIQNYYAEPGTDPKEHVTDDPIQSNPENDPRVLRSRDGVPVGGGAVNTGPADVSSPQAKSENRAIEKALEPGRKVDEKAKRSK